MAKGNTMKQWH